MRVGNALARQAGMGAALGALPTRSKPATRARGQNCATPRSPSPSCQAISPTLRILLLRSIDYELGSSVISRLR
jgi:hypothetical protein